VKKSRLKESDIQMLTETELELMNHLWKLGEGSVNDVLERLPAERDLAYTSVSTILRILEQKGILFTRKEGRGHIYVPLLQKSDYEARAVKHMVDRVFDGTPIALIRQLLDSGGLKESDLKELKNLIQTANRK
jgi:predicted transcriptional regulator